MLTLTTRVQIEINDISPIYDFLLNCDDNHYQKWWRGVHLSFHTTKEKPGEVGSEIYMDEIVGSKRIRFNAIIVKAEKDKEIVWQMKKIMLLPAWLTIRFKSKESHVVLIHTFSAGFSGFGRIFDPIIRLYLNKHFEKELAFHAQTEFPILAKMLRG